MEKNYNQYIEFISDQEIKNLLETDKQSFIGVIPKGIESEKALMHAYFYKLNLPAYFGGNWNALNEVLIDFDWINAENIVILHKDIPNLALEDLKLLIKVLGRAVSIMGAGTTPEHLLPTGKHKLRVIFPESLKEKIQKISNF